MAMVVRQCDTERIAQCSMTRASPEATERRHRATGSRQGDNQHSDNAKYTHFDGHFDGDRNAAVVYRAHRPMEEVHGFHKSH
jgi:hypothetical protein